MLLLALSYHTVCLEEATLHELDDILKLEHVAAQPAFSIIIICCM
jgi:hypothetical protein